MSRYQYRIYYRYEGPTSAAPLRTEKTPREIDEALQQVASHLVAMLDDETTVEVGKIYTDEYNLRARLVTISTLRERPAPTVVVAKCLDELELYGVIVD